MRDATQRKCAAAAPNDSSWHCSRDSLHSGVCTASTSSCTATDSLANVCRSISEARQNSVYKSCEVEAVAQCERTPTLTVP
eukprot:4144504-Pleurochrysis_carterae.AAC.3